MWASAPEMILQRAKMYHIGMLDALNAVPSQHDAQGFAWFSIKLSSLLFSTVLLSGWEEWF